MTDAKRKIARIFALCIFLCVGCKYGGAQTMYWLVRPGTYNEIERIGPDLFKVAIQGKVGVITASGKNIIPPTAGTLSLFHDGRAVLTANDERGECLVGCLTDKGQYYKFTDKYYTLKNQVFYSDDVISVADAKGKVGYVDEKGLPVVGFDGRFDRIKPFCEGYAAVFKNKKYKLIDKEGVAVRFRFSSVGEVYGGTNSHKGIVYVWDTEGDFYTYNTQKGGTCRSARRPSDLSLDYLFRFESVTQAGKKVQFKPLSLTPTDGLSVVRSGIGYGYKSSTDVLLSPQLLEASAVANGASLVRTKNGVGILGYAPSGRFEAAVDNDTYKYHHGESVTCVFTLKVPGVWRESNLSLVVTDDSGKEYHASYTPDSEKAAFNVRPDELNTAKFTLKVESEGLHVLTEELSYNFVKKYRCRQCGKDTDVCPYRGSHPVKPKQDTEKKCPTCGKKIQDCKYFGVHG